jgi:Spy/CpxP family protein refolding chaperone
MKSRYFKFAAAGLAIVLVAGIAVSEVTHQHMHRHGMFGAPMFGMFMHRLDLSSDQQAQVKQILQKERPAIRPLMQQMAQAHMQLAQLELSGNVQDAQISALAAQQAQITSQFVVQEARIESELMQVLNSDQKAKLSQMLTEHQQRMMNHAAEKNQAPNQ